MGRDSEPLSSPMSEREWFQSCAVPTGREGKNMACAEISVSPLGLCRDAGMWTPEDRPFLGAIFPGSFLFCHWTPFFPRLQSTEPPPFPTWGTREPSRRNRAGVSSLLSSSTLLGVSRTKSPSQAGLRDPRACPPPPTSPYRGR